MFDVKLAYLIVYSIDKFELSNLHMSYWKFFCQISYYWNTLLMGALNIHLLAIGAGIEPTTLD